MTRPRITLPFLLPFLLAAVLIAFGIARAVERYEQQLMDAERAEVRTAATVLASLVLHALQRRDYEFVQRVFETHAAEHEDLVELTLVAKNGFTIASYRRPGEFGSRVSEARQIRYGYDGLATLTVVDHTGPIEKGVRVLALQAGVGGAAVLLLIAYFMREAHRRRAQAEGERRRADELTRLNARLEQEIAERGRVEQALRALEENQRRILEASGDGIYGFDLDGICTFVNPAALRMFGYEDAGALVGKRIHLLTHHTRPDGSPYPPEECQVYRTAWEEREQTTVHDELFWRADGSSFPVEYVVRPIVSEGKIIGGVCNFLDVTERREKELRLLKLSAAVEQSPVSVLIADAQGNIEYVNPTFERVSGYKAAEAVGKNPRLLKSGMNSPAVYEDLWRTIRAGEHWRGELCNRKKDGVLFWERVHITPLRDGGGRITHFVAIKEDITVERMQAERLLHQAQHDALTDLPNRALILDRLGQAIARAKRESRRVVLLFLDLDDFKKVNDTLGHEAGDHLLVEAGRRLRALVREEDTVGRHGGDEFVIVLGDVTDVTVGERVARGTLGAFGAPFRLGTTDVAVTPSIGVAVYPDDGNDPSALLRNADAAMYAAKDAGRGTFRFFASEMNYEATWRLEMETRMAAALGNREFYLAYQPIIDLGTGAPVGAEALLRWYNPQLGELSPGQFIPLAERNGQIVAIGSWVLETACRQARRWLDLGLPGFHLAVNISPRQFKGGELFDAVSAALAASGLPARNLELEVTEGLFIKNWDEARALLERFHALGARIALDDFGTGYSSLAYLRGFPFDVLKIDSSFVRDLAADPDDSALVSGIITMAESLAIRTVAEGVETREQAEALRAKGCQTAQGYYFARPMSAADLERYLHQSLKLN